MPTRIGESLATLRIGQAWSSTKTPARDAAAPIASSTAPGVSSCIRQRHAKARFMPPDAANRSQLRRQLARADRCVDRPLLVHVVSKVRRRNPEVEPGDRKPDALHQGRDVPPCRVPELSGPQPRHGRVELYEPHAPRPDPLDQPPRRGVAHVRSPQGPPSPATTDPSAASSSTDCCHARPGVPAPGGPPATLPGSRASPPNWREIVHHRFGLAITRDVPQTRHPTPTPALASPGGTTGTIDPAHDPACDPRAAHARVSLRHRPPNAIARERSVFTPGQALRSARSMNHARIPRPAPGIAPAKPPPLLQLTDLDVPEPDRVAVVLYCDRACRGHARQSRVVQHLLPFLAPPSEARPSS